MLVNPRRNRRPLRFATAGIRNESRRRQQHAASAYSAAILEAVLAAAMIVAGVRAYQAVESHAPTAPLAARLVLPLLFLVGAAFALRSCAKNIQSVRESSQSHRPEGDQ